MEGVCRERLVSVEVNMVMFEGIVVPTVLYGCEPRAINAPSRNSTDMIGLKCLRTITRLRWFDKKIKKTLEPVRCPLI